MGFLTLWGWWDYRGLNTTSQNLHLATYDSRGISTDQWFCLLWYCFWLVITIVRRCWMPCWMSWTGSTTVLRTAPRRSVVIVSSRQMRSVTAGSRETAMSMVIPAAIHVAARNILATASRPLSAGLLSLSLSVLLAKTYLMSSISQSKHVCISPYVVSESKFHNGRD